MRTSLRIADASGRFALQAPRGWTVQRGAPGELTVVAPGGGAAAMRRARFLPVGTPLGRWLAHDFAAGEPGLQPARTLLVDERSATLARAAIDYGGQLFRGRAGVVALRDEAGDGVSLYIAAAPCERYAACLPRLVRILDSLRPRPAAAASLDLADLLRFGASPRGARPRSTHPIEGPP